MIEIVNCRHFYNILGNSKVQKAKIKLTWNASTLGTAKVNNLVRACPS